MFMLSKSRRITDKITALIYETQEECNEVKKNKRKREKKTSAPLWQGVCSCDWAWPWKVQKNFVCTTRAVLPSQSSILPSPMPAFYSSNHGTAGSGLKLGSPKHLCSKITPLHTADLRATMQWVNLTMAVPTMLVSHAPTNLGRGTDELRKASYFVFG